jgi:hypothetical protein
MLLCILYLICVLLLSACRAGVELWARTISDDLVAGAGHVSIARTVHSLHFLVDGINESLWSNALVLDPAAGRVVPSKAVTLGLTWQSMGGLFGLVEEGKTLPQVWEVGGIWGSSAAMKTMPQHLRYGPRSTYD